ncbi:MAG: lipid-A-disaccharide synthase [Bernardetiaceae bacterium]
MNYYLIAGEKSGDLHAGRLMHALRTQDTAAHFRGWGGEAMQSEGLELVKHYNETAFMGFWEVVKNLKKIKKLLQFCQEDLLAHRPDVLILIDYPGFNLRMAKFAHEQGIRVFYFISPKIWAWNSGRVHKIKKYVDKMFSILPFEQEFYQRYDFPIDYVGNPLYDAMREFVPSEDFDTKYADLLQKPVIALLPGSRRMELKHILPRLLGVQKQFPNCQCIIAGVSSLPKSYYKTTKNIPIIWDQTYELLARARVAVVASGTATLETALFDVPQVVVYRTSPLTAWIAKRVIQVRYISLVNLILDRAAVPELIQKDFKHLYLYKHLELLLENTMHRQKMKAAYQVLQQKLHTEGAAERAASLMWKYLSNNPQK